MRYVERGLRDELTRAARGFPALIVTGPRRAGKTTLLRHAFPRATYRLLEDPAVVARVRSDPHAFLDELTLPAVLDEMQNTPELFAHVRARIDAAPTRMGKWLLTGSQEAGLMQGVTESMAGRAAVFQLLPLSTAESPKVSLLHGGFPEVIARPSLARTWFRSYVQTYLERDVRSILAVRDLATFRRFIALVASRIGQVLNRSDLAAPLGVSVPTITEWLSVLETTGQILLVPPFFESFGKRLIKSPKLYFVDSGLACHLLGIEDKKTLARSTFRGALFEGLVASEIVKQQLDAGRAKQIYYFRDQQGLEVDFVVPRGAERLWLIEAKASSTLRPADGTSVSRLASAITRYETEGFVVADAQRLETGALRPGVRGLTLRQLVGQL